MWAVEEFRNSQFLYTFSVFCSSDDGLHKTHQRSSNPHASISQSLLTAHISWDSMWAVEDSNL